MRGQQITRVSGTLVIVLSLAALFAVQRVHSAAPTGRRQGGTYLSALNRAALNRAPLNRAAGADDPGFCRPCGLEAAFGQRAPIGTSSRRFGSRVWSAVSP